MIDPRAERPVIQNTLGYTSESYGTQEFSGDGSNASFDIEHQLSASPASWSVTAVSKEAANNFYVTANSDNLKITFIDPPRLGKNNVTFVWKAWTAEVTPAANR